MDVKVQSGGLAAPPPTRGPKKRFRGASARRKGARDAGAVVDCSDAPATASGQGGPASASCANLGLDGAPAPLAAGGKKKEPRRSKPAEPSKRAQAASPATPEAHPEKAPRHMY